MDIVCISESYHSHHSWPQGLGDQVLRVMEEQHILDVYKRDNADEGQTVPGGWPMPWHPAPSTIVSHIQWRTSYSGLHMDPRDVNIPLLLPRGWAHPAFLWLQLAPWSILNPAIRPVAPCCTCIFPCSWSFTILQHLCSWSNDWQHWHTGGILCQQHYLVPLTLFSSMS